LINLQKLTLDRGVQYPPEIANVVEYVN